MFILYVYCVNILCLLFSQNLELFVVYLLYYIECYIFYINFSLFTIFVLGNFPFVKMTNTMNFQENYFCKYFMRKISHAKINRIKQY